MWIIQAVSFFLIDRRLVEKKTNNFLFFLWQWHAFSVPELQNFLVILEKEEAERVRAVEHKYTMYRQKLQRALQQHDPWPPSPVTLRPQPRERLTPSTRQDQWSNQRLKPELSLSPPSTRIPKHTVHPDTDAYPFSGRIQAPPPSSTTTFHTSTPWGENQGVLKATWKATGCVVC